MARDKPPLKLAGNARGRHARPARKITAEGQVALLMPPPLLTISPLIIFASIQFSQISGGFDFYLPRKLGYERVGWRAEYYMTLIRYIFMLISQKLLQASNNRATLLLHTDASPLSRLDGHVP